MGYHHRLDVCLADLQQSIRIQSPDFQRVCSQSRINAIVNYQKSRLDRGEPLLFCGDIIFGQQKRADDNSVVWWIIDGQHRVAAMKRLAELRPDDTVSVSVYDIDSTTPGAPSLEELFRLVNQSTPVPEYIIRCTMDAQRRHVYVSVEAFIRRRYCVFLSDSRCPRKPNANLTQMMDIFFRSSSSSMGDDGDSTPMPPQTVHEICGYVEWCNGIAMSSMTSIQDEATKSRVETKAKKHGCVSAFYLPSWDPNHVWISSQELIEKWHAAGRMTFDASSSSTSTSTPRQLPRSGIPHAIRLAVWNASFGPEVGVGSCACCSRAINQQDYECGHIVSHAAGGLATPSNLRPLCRACNRSMGKTNLEEFRAQHFGEQSTKN